MSSIGVTPEDNGNKKPVINACVITRSKARSMRAAAAAGIPNTTPCSTVPATAAAVATKPASKRKRPAVTVKKEPVEVEMPQEPSKRCCLLCEDEAATVVFHPCEHQVCCLDCSLRLKKCPRCKKAIVKKERLADGLLVELDKPVISYIELCNKLRELEENQLCTICMQNKKTIAFNCGHLACQSCNNSLTSCHYCRAEIRTRTRIYEV